MASRTVQKRRTSKPPKKRAQIVATADWPDEDELDDGYPEPPEKRWPWISGIILSLLGLADTAYLTYEHYTGNTTLSCSSHGIVNCGAVTTSAYSKIDGVPVVILGLIFFVVMLALQSPQMWRNHNRWLRVGRIVWCLVGIGTALSLIYHEAVDIKALCEYCTGVHVVSFLLFITTALGTNATSDLEDAY